MTGIEAMVRQMQQAVYRPIHLRLLRPEAVDPSVQDEAVRSIAAGKETISTAAERLGVNRATVARWVKLEEQK